MIINIGNLPMLVTQTPQTETTMNYHIDIPTGRDDQDEAAHIEERALHALHMSVRDLAGIGYTRRDLDRLIGEALAPQLAPAPLPLSDDNDPIPF